MVEGYRRQKGKRKLLGNHQRCWLWGRHVVLETLRSGKWRPLELRLADNLSAEDADEARILAAKLDSPVVIESSEQLRKRCRSGEHQGFAAKMPPFPYDGAGQLLQTPPACPLYVIADSIQDPHNFGAIIRCCEVLGVDALFVGSRHQVGVTSLVARSSAGAVNHLPIAQVEDLEELAVRLKHEGIVSAAATEKATVSVYEHDFCAPTAIVIGNEGTGIDPSLLQSCDVQLAIPQSGRVSSLNAAVAAGIILYEARRQRLGNVTTI